MLTGSRRTPPAGFILPAHPMLVDKPPSGPDWTHEVKHDGFRLLARKEGHRVTLWSRSDFTRKETAAARADFLVVERDGFEPEISLAVLPNTQSELPFG